MKTTPTTRQTSCEPADIFHWYLVGFQSADAAFWAFRIRKRTKSTIAVQSIHICDPWPKDYEHPIAAIVVNADQDRSNAGLIEIANLRAKGERCPVLVWTNRRNHQVGTLWMEAGASLSLSQWAMVDSAVERICNCNSRFDSWNRKSTSEKGS